MADTPLSQTPPEIIEFLEHGGYDSMEAWMRDSDYLWTDTDGWVDLDDNPVGAPEGVIEGAMEGWDAVIDSPSGWTYRGSQENGDNVDCRRCGNPLDDNYEIVNDPDQYAYHEACLALTEAEDAVGGDTPGDDL